MEILAFSIPAWHELIRSPRAAFEKYKGKGGLEDALKIVIAPTLLLSIVLFLTLYATNTARIQAAAETTLFFFVYVVVGFLINCALTYAIAKFMKGSGDFKTHAYLLSLLFALVPVLILVLIFLIFVQTIGTVALILVFLYSIYLSAVAVQVAHGFDLEAALVTVGIPALAGILIRMFF